MWTLSFWAATAKLQTIDVGEVAAGFDRTLPHRSIAPFLWVVAGLNGGAWLAGILPALFDDARPGFLDGTGLTTNSIYVQDLAFWIPLVVVSAWWLWHGEHHDRG